MEESEKEVDSGITEATSLVPRGRECFGRVGVLFVAGFLSSAGSGLSFLVVLRERVMLEELFYE